MSRRMERVNVLVRQEISQIMFADLNDPRLSGVVSVTRVDTAPDLRSAKVYISVYGDAEAKKRNMAALTSAGGFIHRVLKRNLSSLKYIPVLSFELDESIEKGAEMIKMINKIVPDLPPENDPDNPPDIANE
ncbi:MAG: ribosome-binding factor A [SAR202 cluster bacterium Casp-Chloro-G4]|nr:30S ribosome-binding factor RbfA [Chloroflexota bacterium]MDA1227573.1 30S ribosome-binding factor RbfA [Chloroflexota bacterium]PKB61019.1 MAG: ribosome-binding factor A [SAR202 cluster bacterium Casp-Chloro-G4]